jgi:hypothetical protein
VVHRFRQRPDGLAHGRQHKFPLDRIIGHARRSPVASQQRHHEQRLVPADPVSLGRGFRCLDLNDIDPKPDIVPNIFENRLGYLAGVCLALCQLFGRPRNSRMINITKNSFICVLKLLHDILLMFDEYGQMKPMTCLT